MEFVSQTVFTCSPLNSNVGPQYPQPHQPAFCRCLSDLQRICSAHELVPQSHILPCAPSDVSDRPIASGPSADVYTGTLDGSEVYVKKARVCSEDDPEKVKVQ